MVNDNYQHLCDNDNYPNDNYSLKRGCSRNGWGDVIVVDGEMCLTSPNMAAIAFVLGPVIEAATHAIDYRRPPELPEEACVDILLRMVQGAVAGAQIPAIS